MKSKWQNLRPLQQCPEQEVVAETPIEIRLQCLSLDAFFFQRVDSSIRLEYHWNSSLSSVVHTWSMYTAPRLLAYTQVSFQPSGASSAISVNLCGLGGKSVYHLRLSNN